MFLLYDGRAKGGDTDRAIVMDTAQTLKEAVKTGRTLWKDYDAVWFQYDERGKELINERMRPDIPPHEGAEMNKATFEQVFGTPEQDGGVTLDSDFQPEGVRLKKIISRRGPR